MRSAITDFQDDDMKYFHPSFPPPPPHPPPHYVPRQLSLSTHARSCSTCTGISRRQLCACSACLSLPLSVPIDPFWESTVKTPPPNFFLLYCLAPCNAKFFGERTHRQADVFRHFGFGSFSKSYVLLRVTYYFVGTISVRSTSMK